MKLLISNQHGAIVMALLPFCYGMLLAQPVIAHIPLILAWFSLYLMTYPFLNLFKPNRGKNFTEYRKWSLIYFIATIIFAIPALIHNWRVVYFMIPLLPLVLINIYYVRKKDERNLFNDLVAIIIFAIVGMAAYYFPEQMIDNKIYWTALYPSLFFIGTTLYVKSVMRERKNPRYFYASVIFHLICVLIFLPLQQYGIALAYLPALVRAVYLPKAKLSVKQVGFTELGITTAFFVILLISTV